MKASIKLIIAGICLLFVAACTSTTVIPQTGNMFTITAQAASEGQATYAVESKAKAMCEQQNAQVKILDREVVYSGVDPAQRSLIALANQVLPKGKAQGPYTPADHDYKATLTFTCEAQ